MKTINIFKYLVVILCLSICSCTNEQWSKYYEDNKTSITNEQVEIVDMTSVEYLDNATDLSDMYQFLKNNDIFEELAEKKQLHTLFLVTNNHYEAVTDVSRESFIANSHVTDIAISPSNLYDGERIMMWHEKYISVSVDSSYNQTGNVSGIEFNRTKVENIVKTSDGYIYVLEKMIETPSSLYDIIDNLSGDYSDFREMVFAENVLTFDKDNSKAIGVDNTGNTIYDSAFIITNPFFEDKSFDLTSESLTATVLIPSNKVIRDAMDQAKATLAAWEMERDTNILRKWILEVAFFSTKYSVEALQSTEDIYSIYSRQWRTTVQELDTDHPIDMSNGVGYYVTKLKIPNNMLIYRLKDFYYYYENCDEEQKTLYFQTVNLKTPPSIATDVTEWTPLAGVWPNIINRVLTYNVDSDTLPNFSVRYVPLKTYLSEDGATKVKPWLIPPGEYTFCMGFKQNLNLSIEVSMNDSLVGSVTLGSATTYHYDRGAGSYPEGYKADLDAGLITHSKKSNYDRDGGPIADPIYIGNESVGPAPISIMVNCPSYGSSTKITLHHWCLRPTENNY